MWMDSLSLWGPGVGLGANTPPLLASIHDRGAQSLFKCFLGPRWSKRDKLSKGFESTSILGAWRWRGLGVTTPS